jgi:hypothetical protein
MELIEFSIAGGIKTDSAKYILTTRKRLHNASRGAFCNGKGKKCCSGLNIINPNHQV